MDRFGAVECVLSRRDSEPSNVIQIECTRNFCVRLRPLIFNNRVIPRQRANLVSSWILTWIQAVALSSLSRDISLIHMCTAGTSFRAPSVCSFGAHTNDRLRIPARSQSGITSIPWNLNFLRNGRGVTRASDVSEIPKADIARFCHPLLSFSPSLSLSLYRAAFHLSFSPPIRPRGWLTWNSCPVPELPARRHKLACIYRVT